MIEVDARVVPHVAFAIKQGYKKVVVLANDTDVLVLLLQYYNDFLISRTLDKTRSIDIRR